MNMFSTYLSWDMYKEDVDFDEHVQYIIKRALGYGLLEDWNPVRRYYGLPKIVEVAKELRNLEPCVLAYISMVSKTSKKQFRRCI